MRKSSVFSLAFVGIVGLFASGCSGDLLGGDQYFVKLDSEPAEVVALTQTIASAFQIELVHTFDSANEGFVARIPDLLVEELRRQDGVEYIKKVRDEEWSPPDENPNFDFDLGKDEITVDIGFIGGPIEADYSTLHVAVIDTGIQKGHPDLEIVEFVDLVCKSSGECSDADRNGHGTHVAGTIGAIANKEGVAGVAPGVNLHAVRVLNNAGSGSWTDIIAGIEYVIDNADTIRVANMSLGGAGTPNANDELGTAIQRAVDAGVVMVIAAGNESSNTNGFVPAGYDIEDTLVVSAYNTSNNNEGGFAGFSNFGNAVDIAAPGVDIISAYPDDTYAALSGTSMAAPHVAGAAAAYYALNPNKTPAQVYDALVNNGTKNYKGQGGSHPEPLLDLNFMQ